MPRRYTHSEEVTQLQRKILTVNVALGQLGDDRLQGGAELAPTLQLLPRHRNFLLLQF